MKKTFLGTMMAAVAALAAAFPGSAFARTGADPLRIAVFTGNGARNTGAFRWLEIATLAENASAVPVDGASIRAGALDAADVIVMPGGRATLEANDLGDEGRAKLKDFIRNGGCYIGTCAGCYLLMESTSKERKYLSILPYKDGASGGRADLPVDFNEKAHELAGIKPGRFDVRYAGGPVPVPTGRDTGDSKFEVVATYAGGTGKMPRKSFPGRPAAFAGTYGKGRIFVFTVHPEADEDDHHLIRGAFRFLTGRDVKWTFPRPAPGQMRVGFLCDDSFGPETGRFIQKLLEDREFDIVPLNKLAVSEGALHRVDAVLAPKVASGACSTAALCGGNAAAAKDFLARGGRVFAWGDAGRKFAGSGIDATAVADAGAALAALRAFAASPQSRRPVRAAVFAGDGARGTGAYRWLEIATVAEGMEAVPVDGAAIRAGALDAADLLIMPGGNSRVISRDLGEEGHRRVKEFLLRGGGYVGTCAGCCLLMQSDKSHKNMMDIIPYTFGVCGGKAEINIAFNSKARALAGIRKGSAKIRYSEGPVPRRSSTADTNVVVEVVATYAGDVNSMGDGKRPSFAGHPAAFAGRYGKGRFFVFTVHPETDVDDHFAIHGAFRYATGRDFEWAPVQRKPGQLAVGFMCDDSFGPETGRFLQKLIKDREFDLTPLNDQAIAEGALANIDAVLAPANTGARDPALGLYGRNSGRTKDFIARGGRVFAWGNAAARAEKYESGATAVESSGAALAALRAFAAEPVPAPAPLPAKVARPVKAAFYADKGGAQYNVAAMLRLAPEYEVVPLSAADIAAGALEGNDMLLMPGGGSKTEFIALGPAGQDAVKRFVRGGGGYYGICAGAFLVRQSDVGLCLVPFTDDKPEHYRGWAPMKIAFTDEGRKVFGADADVRTVMYWGGPVFVPGGETADADVKVLATYAGRLINTSFPKPVKTMAGKGAILGGRVGKGKVYVQGPHPEMWECNQDLVRSGFKYLTGVAPSKTNLPRRRGGRTAVVKFSLDGTSRDQMKFYIDRLLPDPRFNVILCRQMNNNILPHAEVFAILQPSKEVWTWDGKGEPEGGAGGKVEWTKAVAAFVKGGGKVVLLADTPGERAAAEGLEGVQVVSTLDEVLEAIAAPPDAPKAPAPAGKR